MSSLLKIILSHVLLNWKSFFFLFFLKSRTQQQACLVGRYCGYSLLREKQYTGALSALFLRRCRLREKMVVRGVTPLKNSSLLIYLKLHYGHLVNFLDFVNVFLHVTPICPSVFDFRPTDSHFNQTHLDIFSCDNFFSNLGLNDSLLCCNSFHWWNLYQMIKYEKQGKRLMIKH